MYKRKLPASLDDPIYSLSGVGTRVGILLEHLKIFRIFDILLHLPLRYLDYTHLHSIQGLQPGQDVCIEGKITNVQLRYVGQRSLHCLLQDQSGCIGLRFFHFRKRQQRDLCIGTTLRCFGTVRQGRKSLEIVHPKYQIFNHAVTTAQSQLEKNLTPIYPSTEGLPQGTLRKLGTQALEILQRSKPSQTELLPSWLPRQSMLPGSRTHSLREALHYVHCPPAGADTEALAAGQSTAQKRLAYEELLAHQLGLCHMRKQFQSRKAPPLPAQSTRIAELLKRLPFTLTPGQQNAYTDIRADLEKTIPMMRLLQGDVGSGKTIVATLAALQAIDNNWQVAFLAPTEILALQHYRNLHKILDSLSVPLLHLSGKLRQAVRRGRLVQLSGSEALIAIGTHALFQKEVSFARLGLIIIDEQHRFGVRQRMSLLEKGHADGRFPHQLVMTATPIPRTLTLTAYADLDCSIIDHRPPGRQPITTVSMPNIRRETLIDRIDARCETGHQVYWVCPLIEESGFLDCCQAAIDAQKKLAARLPCRRVGLLHGKMAPDEKEKEMQQFQHGNYDILVATTVIEVGIDIPNANMMIIENAERMGLAQLHQLRGRVGRGSDESYCVLLYHPPLNETAWQRLNTLRRTNSGFEIAEQDLALRGPGELLGARQAGLPKMRIADLARDHGLLPDIQRDCRYIMKEYPQCIEPLLQRWTQYDCDNP